MPPRLLFGLGLEADAPIAALAGLPPCDRADVSCRLGSMPPGYGSLRESDWEQAPRNEESCLRVARLRDRTLYRLAYDDGTEFAIDARGTGVWARAPEEATLEDTATYLLGPVMAFVLRLRGVTCLHASCVALGAGAVAFAGHAGTGKSSLAAAFARDAVAVVADDVTALAEVDGEPWVEPAYPRVRLWPEAVAGLFGSPHALPLITPNWDKRFLGLGGGGHRFQERRLPLAAIYLLEERVGPEAMHERLPPAQALMGLVERTHGAHLLDRAMRAREFEHLTGLADRVPVYRLAAAEGLDRLGGLCSEIAARHAHASL